MHRERERGLDLGGEGGRGRLSVGGSGSCDVCTAWWRVSEHERPFTILGINYIQSLVGAESVEREFCLTLFLAVSWWQWRL